MSMGPRRETVTFRDTKIIFKNFSGEEKKFNAKGLRNFSILLGEADAKGLESRGWNVKTLTRQEEDDQQLYHLKVKVNFGGRPPRVYLVSNVDPETGIGRSKTMLVESMIGILDHLESVRVDLIISPYDSVVSGTAYRTAYLQSMFFTMYQDELEQEYANLEETHVIGDSATKQIGSGLEDLEGEVVDGDF